MQEKRVLSIYLLPNILTSGTLFAGFYGIVAAMNGKFNLAALSVFAAMLMDTLDGRVARLTNTQTELGAQYDSLADVVAFGVAPALIAYTWGLHGLHKLGWLIAFIYVATGALRLARFNSQVKEPTPESRIFFTGLPIPSAAAIVSSFTGIAMEWHVSDFMFTVLLAIVTLSISLLMISNIPYYNFKHIDLKGKIPFIGGVLVILAFVAISLSPLITIFVGFSLYAVSGPLFELWRLKQRYRKKP